MIRIAQPLLGEEEERAVLAVLRSGQLAQGPVVRRFEEEFARYIGVREAVAVSSGTAALQVALLAHGIGPGDEVITTPFTFAATANAVLATGARPVFADVSAEDFNLDPARAAERIGERTRALLPVHLYGQPADMDALAALARQHGLALIEDAAQAAGAAFAGRRAGSFGTGCFSFYATKNMTTGEGGMITTDDPDLAGRARLLRSHGERRRYVSESLGYNLRLTETAAALGLAQLEKLDGFNERRCANARYLTERLSGVEPRLPHSEGRPSPSEAGPPSAKGRPGRQAEAWPSGVLGVVTPRELPGRRHVYHQYTIRVRRGRDALLRYLRERDIEATVFYPLPVHKQPLYRGLGYRDRLPVVERLSREVLSLPVHPGLTKEDLDTIVSAVHDGLGGLEG